MHQDLAAEESLYGRLARKRECERFVGFLFQLHAAGQLSPLGAAQLREI
jgi:hypothetical protein